MNQNRALVLLAIGVLSWTNLAIGGDEPAGKPEHRVLACDKGKVAIVNANGQVEWEYGPVGECHDVWMLANGNVLLPLNSTTIVEVTPAKKIVWR